MEKMSRGRHINPFKKLLQQLKLNRPAWIAVWLLFTFLLIALLAPYLANHRPLYAEMGGKKVFPAFHPNSTYLFKVDGSEIRVQNDITDWRKLPLDRVVWPLVPYSPGKNDYDNAGFKGPGDNQFFTNSRGEKQALPARFRHILGTNNTGEDVASGLVHGARVSLSIGLISMAIAAFLGILLGAMAGYFGDSQLSLNVPGWIGLVLGLLAGWFYGFRVRRYVLAEAWNDGGNGWLALAVSIALFLVLTLSLLYAGRRIGKGRSKRIAIPLDSLVSRVIEILQSLPVFILILTIAAVAKPSLTNVMVVIGLTSWSGIARLTRAEFLRVRSLEYVAAARALGFSHFRIMARHALPNCIAPAMVQVAFGIAAAILVESSLSFLGVGVPPDTVTWGAMINEGRQQFSAWWLVLFPGLCIFLTVTAYNLLGDALRDAMDPTQNRTRS